MYKLINDELDAFKQLFYNFLNIFQKSRDAKVNY